MLWDLYVYCMVGDKVEPVNNIEVVSLEVFRNKYPDEAIRNHAMEQRLAGIQFAALHAACEEDRERLQRLHERQADAFEA